MRIVYVLDDTLDSTDGVQQYVRCVGEWMRLRGHDVSYIVGATQRRDLPGIYSIAQNVRVTYNGNRLSIPLPVERSKIRVLLSQLQPDILHVQAPYSPAMSGRVVSLAADETAVVGTFHVLPYTRLARFGNGILGKINTRTAKRFDAMMAVSPPAQAFACHLHGFRSVIVANPFVHDVFSAARRGRKKPNAVTRIVFLGRLVERKGVEQLLHAIAYLCQHKLYSGPFEVIIAGRGKLLPRLQDFTRDHNLTEVVSFSGFIEEADKAALLESADIAVFPSIAGESFGISLLEAMAASRGAVLGGNNPGYASVVASRTQLIDPNDIAGFAAALADLLAHPAKRTVMAKRQQAHVAQFDIDVIGPKIEALYQGAKRQLSETRD